MSPKRAALGELEDHVRSEKGDIDKTPKKADKKSVKAEAEPEPLSEQAQKWAESEWARGWAVIDPALKNVDLQPYVFVTRDKRGYFGSFAASSHLEAIVERMLGRRLVVRQSSAELAKLTGTDPEQVFDALTVGAGSRKREVGDSPTTLEASLRRQGRAGQGRRRETYKKVLGEAESRYAFNGMEFTSEGLLEHSRVSCG